MTHITKEIVFYYRNGCHLCEEMAAGLHAGWPSVFDRLTWIDVDESAELREKYGEMVPVLLVDGELICRFMLDPDSVSRCFGPADNPV